MNAVINRIKENNKVKIVDNIEDDQNKVVDLILELYRDKKLVPVICDDMFEYKNPNTGELQSLHSHIVEEIIKNNQFPLELTETELDDIVKENYYGMSLLENKVRRPLYKDVYTTVVNKGEIKEGIQLKRIVTDFLKVCQFPLIVTTSCFGIIEKDIDGYEEVWKKYKVKDSIDKLPEKCVYHIFDKAAIGNSNWGYNERQILNYLSSYEGDYSLTMLKSIIQNGEKTLLILGNDTPDWMFRFILKNINGGELYNDNIGLYIGENIDRENAALNLFLKDIHFDKNQLDEVLEGVTEGIRAINNGGNNDNGGNNKRYDIFLAHASEDNEITRNLCQIIDNHALKSWVDYNDIRDGNYWQRIINGINNARYFMPIITGNYINKIKTREDLDKILNELRIDINNLNAVSCLRLENRGVSGVQIELLLATIRERNINNGINNAPRESYSLPVLVLGSEFRCLPIDVKMINTWSEDSRMLPENLFGAIQLNTYDRLNPNNFTIEWERYRNNQL
ncbi:MAG: hypothetical protein E7066_09480 [Lentimicrobiaceae bacterium]|nr:hypothetical protein [Lentimicrobiaceae bacterium]